MFLQLLDLLLDIELALLVLVHLSAVAVHYARSTCLAYYLLATWLDRLINRKVLLGLSMVVKHCVVTFSQVSAGCPLVG